MKKLKKVLLITALMLFALSACSTATGPAQLSVRSEVYIPSGYTFLDASAYGGYSGVVTYYCQQNETGRVFECTSGNIGREVIVPDGYFLIGVSAYGQYTNVRTFYCGREDTDRVFICNPQ